MSLENSLIAIVPISIIIITSLLVLLLDVFLKREDKNYLAFISLAGLMLSGAVAFSVWNKNLTYFKQDLILDNFSLFFFFFFLVSTALVILSSMKYILLQKMNYGEFYTLLLLSLSGIMIITSSMDLLVILLGLEVLAISSYVLAGIKREDVRSSEAAIKYFLLGGLASAFLIYGLALLYGASNSTQITNIVHSLTINSNFSLLALTGFGLLIIGFCFKIALVPFHIWTPDVYHGSPTPVAAFFSVGPKAAGFAVFIRIFTLFWPIRINQKAIFLALWIIALLTITVGNLVALRQKNIKRILAYSSIAHAGYMLIAILSQDNQGLLFYLIAYLFMNLGAFAAIIAMSKKGEEYLELEDYAGIGFKYPWLGGTLAVFLFSLAGFPPTAGFLAKFYIFSSAVRNNLISLTMIGIIGSLISVFYYLRIVVYMYMKSPIKETIIDIENPPLFLVLFICLLGVFQLGIFPGNILYWINQAISSLGIF